MSELKPCGKDIDAPAKMTKLKACPFCGGKIQPFVNYNYDIVLGVYEHEPKECILKNLILTNDEQIQAWNKREGEKE